MKKKWGAVILVFLGIVISLFSQYGIPTTEQIIEPDLYSRVERSDEDDPRSITIYDPTSTSKWKSEYPYYAFSIRWSFTGDIWGVNIQLFKNGFFERNITTYLENLGSHYFGTITGLENSAFYQIKVSDVENPSIYDFSEFFIITSGSFDITSPHWDSPDNLTKWKMGSVHTISWTSTGIISNVKIELHLRGSRESVIIPSTENDGSYEWEIPTDLETSNEYQIKLIDDDCSIIFEFGNSFRITRILFPPYKIYILIGLMGCVVVYLILRKSPRFSKNKKN